MVGGGGVGDLYLSVQTQGACTWVPRHHERGTQSLVFSCRQQVRLRGVREGHRPHERYMRLGVIPWTARHQPSERADFYHDWSRRPCGAGYGSRGSTSRGEGSGSRYRKVVCRYPGLRLPGADDAQVAGVGHAALRGRRPRKHGAGGVARRPGGSRVPAVPARAINRDRRGSRLEIDPPRQTATGW